MSPLGRSAPSHSRPTANSDRLKTRFDDMNEAERAMIIGCSAASLADLLQEFFRGAMA